MFLIVSYISKSLFEKSLTYIFSFLPLSESLKVDMWISVIITIFQSCMFKKVFNFVKYKIQLKSKSLKVKSVVKQWNIKNKEQTGIKNNKIIVHTETTH